MTDQIVKSFTQSQLAKALDINQGIVAMAIKRERLFVEDKLININKPINELWFQKQLALGKTFDINRIYKKKNKEPSVQKEVKVKKEKIKEEFAGDEVESPSQKETSINDKSGLLTLEIEKKQLDIEKIRKTIRLDEIRILKMEGQLLPFDATANVFLFAAETFRASFMQELKSLANVFVQRLGGEQKHLIELQKDLTAKVDEIYLQAKEEILSGIEGVVEEYKEVRNRGERK